MQTSNVTTGPIAPFLRQYGAATLLATLALAGTGCATGGASPGTPESKTPASQATVIPESRTLQWPVKTREHVDLWLHGFAMVYEDTTLVPLFRRGYHDQMTVAKNSANVLTQLDANVDRLRERARGSRVLLNAQFVPLYFASMQEMHDVIEHFVAVDGNPRGARSQEEAMLFNVLSGYFPSSTDRSWLALFSSSLWDESAKFYHSYWTQQQRARANVIDSVQAMWQHSVRPRIQRFLNNTQQKNGDIYLSLPIGGEGRTLTSGTQRPVTTIAFPARPSDVPEAFYVLAHELVGAVTNGAVADNITPAEQRNGVADKLASAAAVRGGLLLMEKMLPELADGYAQYYIRATGKTPSSTPRAQIATLFPLPDAVRDAIARQLDTVQGGI